MLLYYVLTTQCCVLNFPPPFSFLSSSFLFSFFSFSLPSSVQIKSRPPVWTKSLIWLLVHRGGSFKNFMYQFHCRRGVYYSGLPSLLKDQGSFKTLFIPTFEHLELYHGYKVGRYFKSSALGTTPWTHSCVDNGGWRPSRLLTAKYSRRLCHQEHPHRAQHIWRGVNDWMSFLLLISALVLLTSGALPAAVGADDNNVRRLNLWTNTTANIKSQDQNTT